MTRREWVVKLQRLLTSSITFGRCLEVASQLRVPFYDMLCFDRYCREANGYRNAHKNGRKTAPQCRLSTSYSICFKIFLCRGIGEETQFPKGKGSGLTLRVSCTSLLCKLFVHIRSRLLYPRHDPDGERMVQKPRPRRRRRTLYASARGRG